MLLLSADEVLTIGLSFVNYQRRRSCKKSRLVKKLKSFYGSSPLVLSLQWKDLCTTEVTRARVDEKSQNEKGFRLFMCVHHFRFCHTQRMGWCWGLALAARRAQCHKSQPVQWPMEIHCQSKSLFILWQKAQ